MQRTSGKKNLSETEVFLNFGHASNYKNQQVLTEDALLH